MNKIKCYINDNYIDILKDNKFFHIVSKNISKGNIIDSKNFIKEIKNKKIFSYILSSPTILYLNKEILEKDIIYYKYIYEELNINNIKILSTSDKLTNNTLIVNSNYYILYTNNTYNYIGFPLLNSYINYYDISKITIISNTKIPIINNVKYYYYNNFDTYFLK